MNTQDKKQQADQLRLAAEIIETGHSSRRSEIRLALASFQLPPPPPGMKWHREDGWEEGDLPQGYRPLVLEEHSGNGTQQRYSGGWVKLHSSVIADPLENPMRTTRPLKFAHAGKEWTWHRPGDPMPCDEERKVDVCFASGDIRSNGLGQTWDWNSEECKEDPLIGWRYADERKTVSQTSVHPAHRQMGRECLGTLQGGCGMKCDECDRTVEMPSICDVCRLTKLDLEADEAWPAFLAQLRYGAKDLDAINDLMLGWQYIGGDVRYEKTSKGVEVGQVYAMAFSKHEGQVTFSHNNGRPVITVTRGNLAFHDWQAVFTPSTPFHLVNDALNAASKQ